MRRTDPTNYVAVIVALVALGLAVPAQAADVLYAPSNPDNPSFRIHLSALLGGPVDYCDARTMTPSVSLMLYYDAVFTWCDYYYADSVAMGNNLADYVDRGGRVILGYWCRDSFGSAGLHGRIMDDPAYCPVASIGAVCDGSYMHDGMQCPTQDVDMLVTSYLEVVDELRPGAGWDGHIGETYVAVWNAPMNVWYSPGNLGSTYESGDWATLTANMCTCQAAHAIGDLNCDGVVNAFDIDPFVLALSDSADYARAWPECDYTLADCNGDGNVNVFDIDPFVALLVGTE